MEDKKAEELRKIAEAERSRLLRIRNNFSQYCREIVRSRWPDTESGAQKEKGDKKTRENTALVDYENTGREQGDQEKKNNRKARNQENTRKKKSTCPDPVARAVLITLLAASSDQEKEVCITQKKILENLKLYQGVSICKQTLINKIKWLEDRGYIRRKVRTESLGRGGISKKTSYLLSEKAFALLEVLVRLQKIWAFPVDSSFRGIAGVETGYPSDTFSSGKNALLSKNWGGFEL